jgi:hypothetical protein
MHVIFRLLSTRRQFIGSFESRVACTRLPPRVLRAAHVGGAVLGLPLFLLPGSAVVSVVKGSPGGCRTQRDAQHR